MNIPYSISSHLNCYLTTFRNLDGREENWPAVAPQGRIIPYSFYLKASLAEVGFGLILVVALVETVVYACLLAFSVIGLIIGELLNQKDIFEKPFINQCDKLYSTTSIMIITTTNFFKNFKEPNLPTREPTSNHILERQRSKEKSIELINAINTFDMSVEEFRQSIRDYKTFLQENRYIQNPHKYNGFELLRTILERPENQTLKEDLQNELSSEAIQFLSFLSITECLLTPTADLDFLCPQARTKVETLQQNQNFKDQLKPLQQTHPHLFVGGAAQDFDQIEVEQLEEPVQATFKKIKKISQLAIQASPLFDKTLADYLDHLNNL